MKFLVKARLITSKLGEFNEALAKGELDTSAIRGETYCLQADPAAGYNIWEAADREEFEQLFSGWREYSELLQAEEITGPEEAMGRLLGELG